MFRIAYCDDNHNELSDLCALLSRYQGRHPEIAACEGFLSPLELVDHIRSGTAYNIILLDVLMPGMTGIQAATEIRKCDTRVKIIFLTSSQDFAVESYAVKAILLLAKAHPRKRFVPSVRQRLGRFLARANTGLCGAL